MLFKRATTLQMALVIGFLVISVMLKPTVCRAQAEINPDHYEGIQEEPFASAHNGAAPNRNVDGQDKLALFFDAGCPGLTLLPGTYSLSVQSLGNENVVTLTRESNAAKAQATQARLSFRSSVCGSTVRLVERKDQSTGPRKTKASRISRKTPDICGGHPLKDLASVSRVTNGR